MNLEWLKAAAPTLATALGGPLAGIAASFVAEKLGVPQKTVEAVKEALVGLSPDQLVALKQADADLKKFFVDADIKIEQLNAADRDSARKANVAGGISRDVFGLTVLLLTLTFGVEGYILINGLPVTASPELFGRILGTLDAIAMAAVWHTYGTTRDSGVKTQALIQGQK